MIDPHEFLSPPARAIVHTLAYSRVFTKTTSWQAVTRWLLGPQRYSMQELDVARSELQKSRVWSKQLKIASSNNQSQKWHEVVRFVFFIRTIPWIQSVWVTGSVAAQSAGDDDDIDFFIVTDPGRLWLSRLVVVIGGILVGKYRRHDIPSHQVRNQWCCNMWLEGDRLPVFWLNQNVYTARELVQARPVYVRWDASAESLLVANPWVEQWTAMGYLSSRRQARLVARSVLPVLAEILRKIPLCWINELMYQLQFWVLRRHMTTEQVEKGIAFFHPRSLQHPVVKQYEKIGKQWNLPPLLS